MTNYKNRGFKRRRGGDGRPPLKDWEVDLFVLLEKFFKAGTYKAVAIQKSANAPKNEARMAWKIFFATSAEAAHLKQAFIDSFIEVTYSRKNKSRTSDKQSESSDARQEAQPDDERS